MQVHQLRYFVAVAESRHFTRAAAEVGVTQPALSKQIHVLESELGARLFHRERGNITLTEAGDILLPLARSILADVNSVHSRVQELVGLRRGRLRLGATPSLCTTLVAPLLHDYRTQYPGIELVIEENGSQDLVGELSRGRLDLALLVSHHERSDASLQAEPILNEPLVLASAMHGPSELPARISPAELRLHPLVMFRPGYDLRQTTIDLCARHGFAPTFAIEGGEMDAVLSFVEAGIGVAVVPRMVLTRHPNLRVTELDTPDARRTIALAHRREAVLPHTALAFRTMLRSSLVRAAERGELAAGVTLLSPDFAGARS